MTHRSKATSSPTFSWFLYNSLSFISKINLRLDTPLQINKVCCRVFLDLHLAIIIKGFQLVWNPIDGLYLVFGHGDSFSFVISINKKKFVFIVNEIPWNSFSPSQWISFHCIGEHSRRNHKWAFCCQLFLSARGKYWLLRCSAGWEETDKDSGMPLSMTGPNGAYCLLLSVQLLLLHSSPVGCLFVCLLHAATACVMRGRMWFWWFMPEKCIPTQPLVENQ